MNWIGKLTLVMAMAIVLTSCKKKTQPSPREEQLEIEITQPLKANEILEQEGVRFLLNYDQTTAQIALKLYKGNTIGVNPVSIIETQPYVNYAVQADQLDENSEYVLALEFKSISKNGSADISLIGFTEINGSKIFDVKGIAYTTAQTPPSKAYIKITKGIRKFSFYVL
ncbi:MAG: hypothetical protein EOO04_14160 [Chitinophagaceae bacterium]|nr:MAG: hypothetical protein EOO04_14160 [Chitinophagaceae bacterium]